MDKQASIRGRRRKGALDQLDLDIVERLQQSGRVSNSKIARQLNVSESTVRKRVDRLLANEVIRITAVPDPLKLDYPLIAIVCIQAVPSRISQVAQDLEAMPEFRFIGLTTGVYDFIAEAWFRTQDDLRQFLTERLLPIEGLARVETAHVLKMIRYAYDWGRNMRPDDLPDGPNLSGPRLK